MLIDPEPDETIELDRLTGAIAAVHEYAPTHPRRVKPVHEILVADVHGDVPRLDHEVPIPGVVGERYTVDVGTKGSDGTFDGRFALEGKVVGSLSWPTNFANSDCGRFYTLQKVAPGVATCSLVVVCDWNGRTSFERQIELLARLSDRQRKWLDWGLIDSAWAIWADPRGQQQPLTLGRTYADLVSDVRRLAA